MLIPHFVRAKFPRLDQSYISLLEIGGAHAHRLKPLLDTIGLLSLVVTDVDSILGTGSSKARPERGKGYRTGNTTLKGWVPQIELLDDLLDLSSEKKTDSRWARPGRIPVPNHCEIQRKWRRRPSGTLYV